MKLLVANSMEKTETYSFSLINELIISFSVCYHKQLKSRGEVFNPINYRRPALSCPKQAKELWVAVL